MLALWLNMFLSSRGHPYLFCMFPTAITKKFFSIRVNFEEVGCVVGHTLFHTK